MKLSQDLITKAIEEIGEGSEVTRRALVKRRLDIYKDGGKHFLIDQIKREFSEDALKEMRLAPINLLKKIVNKRASIYKKAPIRKATEPKDQKLLDFYTEELKVNQLFQKANRYFVLFSNVAVYLRPCQQEGAEGKEIDATVVPPHLYSKVPDPVNQERTLAYIFNAFVEGSSLVPFENLEPATGQEGYSQNPGSKNAGDAVASNEVQTDMKRQYLFWTDEEQATTNDSGEILLFADPAQIPPELQRVNPIEMLPVIDISKDRDNEAWATQGEDVVDLTIAIQLGWTDVLTIAKHQGFSIMTIVSEEEPKTLTLGINKAVWLKATKDSPVPSISYAQAQSPLAEYKELLMELLGLLLTTNDMEPNAVSGGSKGSAQTFTSGFHALIAKADTLEAIENDKPTFLSAEKEFWEVVKAWHNYLFDSKQLNPEATALGKFSEGFEVSVTFSDAKPLESEDDRLKRVETKLKLGLLTKELALKELYPDMGADQIAALLKELEQSKGGAPANANDVVPSLPSDGQGGQDVHSGADTQDSQSGQPRNGNGEDSGS